MKISKLFIIIFLLAIAGRNAQAQEPSKWSDAENSNIAPDGSGQQGDPYKISSPQQLAYVAKMVNQVATGWNTAYFELTADIDLGAHLWDVPIGNNQTVSRQFRGKFNGNDKTIRNMKIADRDVSLNGLFGYTTDAEIENITMEGGYISNVGSSTGFLIGYAVNSRVENCIVKNVQIRLAGTYLGGVIGYTSGTTVTNCHFSGSIIGTGHRTGGLTGWAEGYSYVRKTIIDGCSAEGTIQGVSNVGGLIGWAQSFGDQFSTVIKNSYSACQVTGSSDVGGFIGSVWYRGVDIDNCQALGSITGLPSLAGGFIGILRGSAKINNCIVEGKVSGLGVTSGFIGQIFYNDLGNSGFTASISGCQFTGDVEGLGSSVAGFLGGVSIGSNHGGISIVNCSVEGTVVGHQSYVGGFIASNNTSDISVSNCYTFVSVKGNNNVGGFSGQISLGSFSECYAVATVEGNRYVGGFSGDGRFAHTDCYAIATVKGNQDVGGFVGFNNAATYTNCFAVATVLGGTSITTGAFAGSGNLPAANSPNCYFDRQIAAGLRAIGSTTTTNIQAFSTSEMTPKEPFTDFSSEKWVFVEGFYPQLKAFADPDNPDIDATTRLHSALSVVPFKLANDELVDNVQTLPALAGKTSARHDITWSANLSEKTNVVKNVLYTAPYGEDEDKWRTLTLRVGDTQRTVIFKFKTEQYFTTPNILGVKINGVTYDFKTPVYSFPCGSHEVLVMAELVLCGFANSSLGSPIPLHANLPLNVTITTLDGERKTHTLFVEKPLPESIFVQRWEDVLAVNNNPFTNGGYEFTGYKWYKDNVLQPGETKGYIRLSSGTADYKVHLTGKYIATQADVTINTCPTKVTNTQQTKMAVYPNPVGRGQTVRVAPQPPEGGNFPPSGGLRGAATLFDAVGNIVATQNINVPVAEIVMPDTPGTYILQIDGKETFKVVVTY